MAPPLKPAENRVNTAIGLLMLSQVVLLVLDISAKSLAITGMPTGEIVFVRYGMHFVLLLLLFLPIHGKNLFRSGNLKLELARGFCLLGTTTFNFWAMSLLPLTVTSAIAFTAPLMVCALSGPMLGEKVGWRRWAAIGVGFIGTLIIVRPGSEAFQPAALLSLGCAVFLALFTIFTRKISGTDGAITQQFYASIVPIVLLAPVATTGWVWPQSSLTWLAFFAMGAAGLFGHILNSMSLKYAGASILAPYTYLSLVYLSLASWLVFNEPPDALFVLGASIIIGSGIYIWLRERKVAKQVASVPLVD